MPFNPKEYQREYRKKNKEKIKKAHAEWREKNKDKIKGYYEKTREEYINRAKIYNENNKEKIKEYKKEWVKTPEGRKSQLIRKWTYRKIKCDDFSAWYDDVYMNTHHCEECGCEFGEFGDGTLSCKCLDHDHETGEIRNILCSRCNLQRK
jgi:hypothetical protein